MDSDPPPVDEEETGDAARPRSIPSEPFEAPPAPSLDEADPGALLAAIAASTEDAIVGKTLDGIVRFWNPGAERIFGYAASEMLGRSIERIIPADLRAEEQEILARLARGERIHHFETVRQRKDGLRIDVSLTISPIRGGDGRVVGASKIARDVTERKRVERSLSESESRFHTLADNIAQLAWMAAPDGSVFWYNERWFEYTGSTLEEMKGWGWEGVHHPDHVDRVVREFRRAIVAGEEWEDTFPLRSAEGEYRWFLSRALPIRDAEGKVLRWFGTNTDITDRIRMEEALLEADRRKDRFLATLAHELRNPLAPIRSGIQWLRRTGDPTDRLPQVVRSLERQTDHLIRLVDDLMDVSRITRGKIELQSSLVPLEEILDAAVEISQPAREERKHRLTQQLDGPGLWVEGDATRLIQVFGNLLNNASKYTPTGGSIRLEAAADRGEIVVRVADTGQGIPEERLGEIFEPFVQGREEGFDPSSGLGIGLTLVRSLVKLHGGSVQARSRGSGQGSEFEVRLPRAEAPVAEADRRGESMPGRATGPPRLRILVADDNRDAADALVALLELEGHRARAVYGGLPALEVGAELQPRAVFLDLGMPDLDGYETARRLRAEPWGRETMLVALTGWSQDADRDRTREAGFDHHVVKPVNFERLLELLATCV